MATMNRKSSHVACIECRTAHLKCDASRPICPRCERNGLRCIWVSSRRGHGGKAKQPQSDNGMQLSAGPQSFGSTNNTFAAGSHQQGASGLPTFQMMSPAETWTSSPPESTQFAASSQDEYFVDKYFTSFHPAHPILLPRNRYNTAQYPEHLHATIKFVGSHYTQFSSDAAHDHIKALLKNNNEESPEMVQSLLLLAIALHARHEPLQAMRAIEQAVHMAIGLGMHTSEFASTHSRGDEMYEESLRRTWWELFVVDGYLSALHRSTTFRANRKDTTTLLPREEAHYATGTFLPPAATLPQLDGRFWLPAEATISSYAYRIDAIRILARVMTISKSNDIHAEELQAVDNAIAAWRHSVPGNKANILERSGDVDPLILQAFTFINVASILLHFPRSELPICMPKSAEISCSQQSMDQVSATSPQHAVKALSASSQLVDLASLSMGKQSPFFICGLVSACAVQVSAYCTYPYDNPQTQERVNLILGVLQSFSHNWPVAEFVLQKLRPIASDVFKVRPGTNAGVMNGAYDFTAVSGLDFAWMNFPIDTNMLDDPMTGLDMSGFMLPS